jgi:hypothetical protein
MLTTTADGRMATATRQQKILLLDSDRPSHGRRLHPLTPRGLLHEIAICRQLRDAFYLLDIFETFYRRNTSPVEKRKLC